MGRCSTATTWSTAASGNAKSDAAHRMMKNDETLANEREEMNMWSSGVDDELV
jgi:hypothetical protein